MGEARRVDEDREAPARAEAPAQAAPDVDEADAEHDGAHAGRQLALQRGADEWSSGSDLYPERQIAGVGDQDALWAKFVAALDAGDGKALPAMVRDMDAAHRQQAGGMLDRIATLLPGRDVLYLGDLTMVSPGKALTHAMTATPPATDREIRAQLASMPPRQLMTLVGEPGVLDALKARFPGSAVNVAPQVLDDEAYWTTPLLEWYLDTTPPAVVAMALIQREPSWAAALNSIGRAGWLWAFHVDDAMARVARPGVLQAYADRANDPDAASFLRTKLAAVPDAGADTAPAVRALRDALDAKPVDVSGALDALRTAGTAGKPALEARRERFVTAATVEEIDLATQLVPSMDPDTRLDWMLDKPGVTVDALREVLTTWERTIRGMIEASTIKRIRKRFGAARPDEVFGVVPDGLHKLALDDVSVRTWIVTDAQPLDVLRLVTFDPDRTAELCRWLVARGIGYDWVYGLGAGADDHLLRRLVLRCPDRAVVAHIKQRLLGDAVETQGPSDDVIDAPDAAYASGASRVDESVHARAVARRDQAGEAKLDATAREVSRRVDELSEDEVMELRHDGARLRAALAQTNGATLTRLLDRINPKLREVLLHAPEPGDDMLGWAAARPADQIREAMAHHTASATARTWFKLGPLELFPPLEDDVLLAQVLLRNPGFIAWIVERSDPTATWTVLGRPGCAHPAAAALATNEELLRWIPAGRALSAPARTGLAAITDAAAGELRNELRDRLRLDAGEDEDLEDVEHNAMIKVEAGAAGSLIDALSLAAASADTSAEVFVRLCRERAAEASSLATQAPHLLGVLHRKTNLSPLLVFPGLQLSELVSSAAGRAWMFDSVPGFELLRKSGHDPTLQARLALDLDEREADALSWVIRLPRGSALQPYEESSLRALATAVTTDAAARRLFAVRFATDAMPEYTRVEILRLWDVLVRVPDAHIEQQSVSWFAQFVGGGAAGAYYPEDAHIGMQQGLDDAPMHETLYWRDDKTNSMSRAEAMDAFGLDDAGLDAWVASSRLTLRADGTYRLNPADAGHKYDATVLHEVGHAVDAMLGGHTELVHGLAGWRVFPESEFDAWATELGGWSSVAPADQRAIREAWQLWLSSTRGDRAAEPIKDMVGGGHAAVADKYASVGVVALARQGLFLDTVQPGLHGDLGALVSFRNQHFYTLTARALRAAPTPYSLTAPAEYFAECYMVYYRQFDGTAATSDKKGDHLATWIKQWLDANIDNVGFNPRRESP